MKLREYLAWAASRFPEGRADNPTLEAEVLIRHALGLDRSDFFTSLETSLTLEQQFAVDALLRRRFEGEPLAYITGRREFYGLDMVVNPGVLIPRQETELLVDKVIEFSRTRGSGSLRIADVGTGGGAIAVAIATRLPQAQVFAVDIDPEALRVADLNRRRHGVERQVELIQGSLLDPLRSIVDVVVSNPPYIPTGELAGLAEEVRREPRHALDGGEDGLDVIRSLLGQVPSKLAPGGMVFLEISPEQVGPLREFTARLMPEAKVSFSRDLSGLDRVMEIQFP